MKHGHERAFSGRKETHWGQAEAEAGQASPAGVWNARQKLQHGAPSVKDAALESGFWHLGDFAQRYQKLFGELPSLTLRSARLRLTKKAKTIASAGFKTKIDKNGWRH